MKSSEIIMAIRVMIAITFGAVNVAVSQISNIAAPTLQPALWIKGSPISNLADGKVYVVEFGSVSCGPCRASIPSLNRISNNFKNNVTVISIYVYENGTIPANKIDTTYVQRVRRFISKMGDNIQFSVAVDGPAQSIADSWLRSNQLQGVPHAFIINQVGQLVWVGHPFELEHVIAEVVHGNFDSNSGPLISESLKNVYEIIDNGSYEKSIETIDSLMAANPENKILHFNKFAKVLSQDESKAYLIGWHELYDCAQEEVVLTLMANEILSHSNTLHSPDWKLFFKLNERALELSIDEINSSYLHLAKSQALSKTGRIKEAINVLQSSILQLEKLNVSEVTVSTKAELQNQLDYYITQLPK